ncbi:melanotransferrin [Strongylocentrotus purpuratus]|uniref:Transferrin-like domain-containing protein n=1 Tax=Strongylocentrotus purpuratus TaxID=7668 RepID=A0A7M7NM99_STRPU|nr:melanotransferrin [Strongylocentrotus purpuratus]
MKTIVFCLLTIVSTALAATTQMRWCTSSTHEEQKCVAMRTAFSAQSLSPEVVCVAGSGISDCLMKVQDGQAHMITLDGGDVYLAGKEYGLVPIVQETYAQDRYAGIAVVRATDSTLTLETLKGKDSCHTGVRRTAGWNIPVGFLLEAGYMEAVDCGDDINAVSNFFNQSCAPGAYLERNDPYGTNPPNLCGICTNKQCPADSSELYQSYAGAFRCLAESAGDVAFIKPQTVIDNTDGNGQLDWNRGLMSSDFRLLCPDNTQSTIDNAATCNLAKSPAHAIVTSPSTSAEDITAFQTVLAQAVALFGDDNNQNGFLMFDSVAYGGNDLLFKDSTQNLANLESGLTYRTYLGDYANTIDGLKMCPANSLRWCTTSSIENKKCRDMSAAFKGANLTPQISCYEETSKGLCVDRIVSGDADVVTLDGGDLYAGGDRIAPIVGESYDVGGDNPDASYWAVAIARKGTQFGMDDLAGRKSCHTGIGKTSGWNVPVGHLIKNEQIFVNGGCEVPKAVGEFFSAGSCAPGAKTDKYDPTGTNPSSLCALCIGTGNDNCVRNANEPYYDYAGAFRCLADQAGDVAFVKHTTVPDNTDGNGAEDWSTNLNSADYELLCADNTRMPITAWETCNLAKVPSHAVVTSSTKTTAQKQEIARLLLDGQEQFGSDSGAVFKMFDSQAYSDTDLLFKDSTEMLVDVGTQDTTEKWLSPEYVQDLDAISCSTTGGGATRTVQTSMVLVMMAFLIQMVWFGVLSRK